MDPNTKIKFSRDGVEIGEYKLFQVEYELKLGTIKLTDHYWCAGMEGWEPVTKLLEIIAKAKKDWEIKRAKTDAKSQEHKQNNFFKCNCCKGIFTGPKTFFDGGGCAVVLLFILAGGIAILFTPQMFIGIGLVLIILCLIICITLHSIRQPSCPQCGSSNFAKPEKPELPPKL